MGSEELGDEGSRQGSSSLDSVYQTMVGCSMHLWTSPLSLCPVTTCLAHKLVDASAVLCVQTVGKNIFSVVVPSGGHGLMGSLGCMAIGRC